MKLSNLYGAWQCANGKNKIWIVLLVSAKFVIVPTMENEAFKKGKKMVFLSPIGEDG